MSQTYSFFHCKVCRTATVHCKPSAQAPHYCIRHESQVLKSYDERKDVIRELIMEAQSGVKRFDAWDACTTRKN